jgi:hypothetical protein
MKANLSFSRECHETANRKKTRDPRTPEEGASAIGLGLQLSQADIEKGGMVVQKIGCANCSASMHLPEKGKTVDCSYCRTTHRPEDIFEKNQTTKRLTLHLKASLECWCQLAHANRVPTRNVLLRPARKPRQGYSLL